ncbi:MAG: glycosyltransferase family 4 protein [Burkholderiales bacterium]
MPDKSRVAYVVNHAAFFVSHRLPLALGARKAGFDVALFTGQAGSEEMEATAVAQLAASGILHRRTVSRSSGMNPLLELLGFLQLISFLLRFRPRVVHCASPKGVLYGGLAARICRVPGVILAISGMGYAFTQGAQASATRRWIRRIYGFLVRFAFGHPNSRVIVQNEDDSAALLMNAVIKPGRVILIPGSGVDLTLFANSKQAPKERMVLLPARMLEDKGVREFVAAARMLRRLVPNWRFVLAGAAGYDNPTAIAQSELEQWQAEGVVEWLGHVEDMVPWFTSAAIVCLPSYREGMPKALLEAAAAGCAVVTTNTTGCREAIEPGVTGDLVSVRDPDALAAALLSIIKDEARRLSYGEKGRQRALDRFSVDSVVQQTVDIYKEILNA